MAEEELSVRMEADLPEGKIKKVATKLAVLLTARLSEHPDPVVLKKLPEAIEASFNKKTATRDSGSVVIVPGEIPKKLYLCQLYWKKQKNYVFTITFTIPKGSGIKPDDIRPKLVYARNIVHEYFQSVRIRSRDIPA